MFDKEYPGSWDFTSALDLIHTLAIDGQSDSSVCESNGGLFGKQEFPSGAVSSCFNNDVAPALGEFEDVWKFLNQRCGLDTQDEPTKSVRWRDELEGEELADNEEEGDEDCFTGMTKVQRKKARRKARRAGQAAAVINKPPTAANNTPSTSQTQIEGPKKDLASPNDVDSEKDVVEDSVIAPDTDIRRSARLKAKAAALSNGAIPETRNTELVPAEEGHRKSPDRKALIHELLGRPLPTSSETQGSMQLQNRPKPQESATRLVPKTHLSLQDGSVHDSYAVAVAKKSKLLSMLKERFGKEGSYLNSPELLHPRGSSFNASQGLHIFIDASNIMIGFHDALKLAHSLPLSSRIRRQPISFHSLSLILSRGRPTTKRVVVGSDKFAEMDEADLLGYETNILNRVHKAKEPTPRQKKYASRENGAISAGSGSETSTAFVRSAPEKWVEQAVDEIIHLKMMESLVDAAEPTTMILATGDAAEAEFSGGFLRMAERVLSKGWSVELACWSHNMSRAYKNKAFRQKWGGKFKVIELDDYVDLLLGS